MRTVAALSALMAFNKNRKSEMGKHCRTDSSYPLPYVGCCVIYKYIELLYFIRATRVPRMAALAQRQLIETE